jgi:hypothetical protein
MKAGRDVDEPGRQAGHVRDRLPDLQHRKVLEHLAANHQVVAVGRLERRIGDLADGDAVAHLRRRELLAALREVDALHIHAELPEQVHQRPGTAAEVEGLPRLEDFLDEERVLRLDGAARFEVVAVAFGAPVAGEVLGVVMGRADGLLIEHPLLELGYGHRWFCC